MSYVSALLLIAAGLSGCLAKPQLQGYAVSTEPGVRFEDALRHSEWLAEDLQGKAIAKEEIALERVWNGNRCVATVRNIGKTTLRPS